MRGSLYSKFFSPTLVNFCMSGASLNGFRKEALLKIGGELLEISFGSGLNLPHYPDSAHKIDAVDVNPAMHSQARKRIEKSEILIQKLCPFRRGFADGRFKLRLRCL